MPKLDMRRTAGTPVGPLRDEFDIDISANDYVLESGFVFHASVAGDLSYRTLDGSADLTRTFAAGGFPAVAGVPVVCRVVRASAAVGTITVGAL